MLMVYKQKGETSSLWHNHDNPQWNNEVNKKTICLIRWVILLINRPDNQIFWPVNFIISFIWDTCDFDSYIHHCRDAQDVEKSGSIIMSVDPSFLFHFCLIILFFIFIIKINNHYICFLFFFTAGGHEEGCEPCVDSLSQLCKLFYDGTMRGIWRYFSSIVIFLFQT